MRHILTAVFTDRGTAQQAMDALHGAGYPDEDTVLAAIPGAGPATGPDWNTASTWPQAGTPAARVLGWIFGHGNAGMGETPWRAPDAYRLTLAADSEPEARRACTLVPVLAPAAAGTAAVSAPSPLGRKFYRHAASRALSFPALQTRHACRPRDRRDGAMANAPRLGGRGKERP